MLHQTLHDVHKAPSRCCQQRTLPLAVLCVHVAACLAECAGHCRVSVPGGAMQWGLLLLEKKVQNAKELKTWVSKNHQGHFAACVCKRVHVLTLSARSGLARMLHR